MHHHTATVVLVYVDSPTDGKNPVGKTKLERVAGGGAVVGKLEREIQTVTSH